MARKAGESRGAERREASRFLWGRLAAGVDGVEGSKGEEARVDPRLSFFLEEEGEW